MGIASPPAAPVAPRERVRLTVRGTVQGVGFRPFVYRVARSLGIGGAVANTNAGVTIEAEGAPEALAGFVRAIRQGPPAPAHVAGIEVLSLAPSGETAFEIAPSAAAGARGATILPDLSTCQDCLREVFDPGNRRYRYPFTNCTHCGPRYSIVEDLPYDRVRTSMRRFPMCAACRAEYGDPADRRFHAEPNACPACGPGLTLWDGEGRPVADRDAALLAAAAAIRDGVVVAVKGLGGFHLMADARNHAAVGRLRARKLREEKPFAVMFPSLARIEAECDLSPEEVALLTAPQRPIVLVRRKPPRASHGGTHAAIADVVAPGNPSIGAILPYTPLHHLLLAALDFPVVATSGNRSEEPIVVDEAEAVARLGGIANMFLVHDRPIVRPVDDSVARIVAGRPLLLRRARGYAPGPVIEHDMPPGILALGGHLKATVALTLCKGAVLSQHIGDLETAEARDAYDRACADIARLHGITPRIVVRDLHPDYHSSQVAEASGLPTVAVQHHLAHVAACMAEHRLQPPVLGVSFDGTGYGPDGTVWGGEFLLVTETGWRRVAHLRPFRLPGSDAAVREPRRSALGLLFELFGPACLAMTELAPVAAFGEAERKVLATILSRGVNAPITTSAGRLFDGVSALLNLSQRSTYEGQAAAALEWAATAEGIPPPRSGGGGPPKAVEGAQTRGPGAVQKDAFPFAVTSADPMVVDWAPAIRALLADLSAGVPAAVIAAAFHHGLAGAIAEVAARVGEKQIVLTGGCFQNAVLTEAAIAALSAAGMMPYWHHLVPPNDGGLALGQAAWAASLVERGEI